MTQITESVDFIKSKGPFPQGELVLLAGNFNIDQNIDGTNKNGSGINEKLNNPETNLLIAARKDEILGEYAALDLALKAGGNFTVTNTNSKKKNPKEATQGLCTFVDGIWVPKNNWGHAADACTNKVTDYIFQLTPLPKSAMLGPKVGKKVPKTSIN